VDRGEARSIIGSHGNREVDREVDEGVMGMGV
jgi:hypothetical protein